MKTYQCSMVIMFKADVPDNIKEEQLEEFILDNIDLNYKMLCPEASLYDKEIDNFVSEEI